MDGVFIINKPAGITSRDVVNQVIKKVGIKKVGHTGTLDPLATGVLVVCVGSATKLVSDLICNEKEYIASVELGTLTDTLDNTGTILKEEKCNKTKEEIVDILNSFKGSYTQEVPIYSAVKINGKKLYEYARNNEKVDLPSRDVTINNIELVSNIDYINDKVLFKIKCNVSKGTYIRSLVRDIAYRINTIGIMTNLIRTKQGKFNIENSICIEEIKFENLLSIADILDVEKIELTDNIKKQVLNGASINNIYNSNEILFINNNEAIALYKGDRNKLKPYKMFKGGML